MATFDATTHPLAFAHMEGGLKTVYVVPNSAAFKGISAGDRVEFDDIGSITVGMIRRYPSLEKLVEVEGHANVVPECDSAEAVVKAIGESPGWNRKAAEEAGVLALRVRSAKRKS